MRELYIIITVTINRLIDEFIKWLQKEKPDFFSEALKFCKENVEDVLLSQHSPNSKSESTFLLCWAEWKEIYDYLYWKNEEPADFYDWINTKPWTAIKMPRSPKEVVKMCREFWPEKD